MDDDLRVAACLAEFSCQLRRFDDRPVRDLFARRIANYHVRTGIITGVHPQVIRIRDAKRKRVVISGGASDENLVTVGREITTYAGDAFRLCSFALGSLWRRPRVGFVEALQSGDVLLFDDLFQLLRAS